MHYLKTIIIGVFLLCGICLQAQSVDSLLQVGEEFYHQKKYMKARNAFYQVFYRDNTNAEALSNLLLTYHKTKEYHSAYLDGHTYFRNTDFIPREHRANIYHNFALNCEAINYIAEALHYYQKANELKPHSIRITKIEHLEPLIQQINSILPKIEKELPKDFSIPQELRKITIPSYHPISTSLNDFLLKKIDDYNHSFGQNLELDSTVQISHLRIKSLEGGKIYLLTCTLKFDWWKNDYSPTFYVDRRGQFIDLPMANQSIESLLIENEENYIINTYYHPRGHGHWMFYTLYRYNSASKQVEKLLDFIKYYDTSPTFCSFIYIKDNHYRIEYGQSDGISKIINTLGDQWLYKKGSINKISIPESYATSFRELQKRYSKEYQFLKYVEFK